MRDSGGSAFPNITPDMCIDGGPGMTLRDYFAGQALIASYLNGFAGPRPAARAVICYEMADAMLEVRK